MAGGLLIAAGLIITGCVSTSFLFRMPVHWLFFETPEAGLYEIASMDVHTWQPDEC